MGKHMDKVRLEIADTNLKRSKLLEKLRGNPDDSEAKSELDKLNSVEFAETRKRKIEEATKMDDETEARLQFNGQALDPEAREKAVLRNRVSLSKMLADCIEGRRYPSGSAEEEYRQMTGAMEREIPLDAFETRADTATNSPSVIGINMQNYVPNIFSRSLANDLMISMPQAESGQFSIPRLNKNLKASMKAKSGVQESSAATFSVISSKPKRLTGRLSITLEDLAESGQFFESALRQNLQSVMSDALDDQILNGNGTAPNLNGLFKQLTVSTDPAAEVNFGTLVSSLAKEVDGKFASKIRDLKLFVNEDVYQKLASIFQEPKDPSKGGGRSVMTAEDWCENKLAGFGSNDRLPAAASNISRCLVCKTGSMNADPMPMNAAVVPVWSSGIAISDPFSQSQAGISNYTVSIILGDVLLRHPEAYSSFKIKTA